jgi:hypothetical protein
MLSAANSGSNQQFGDRAIDFGVNRQSLVVGGRSRSQGVEARAGIEPACKDLQSSA